MVRRSLIGRVRWGSIFYSWLGMSSIQHEIFIESIYNNQKLSILREYSITSCDHQTIFSCFYSPFIDLPKRHWSLIGQPIRINRMRIRDPVRVFIFQIFWPLEFWKNIFFKLGTRQKFFSISGFLDNDDQIFRKL